MKKIQDTILLFMPPSGGRSIEEIRLQKLFLYSCVMTAGFAFLYFLMSVYIDGPLFAAAMAVSVCLFLGLPVLLKDGLPLRLLSHIYIGIIAVVLVLLIYWEGGIRSANTAIWVLFLPAYAMMLLRPREAGIWLLVSLGIVCSFSWLTFHGIHLPVRFDTAKDPLFNVLSMTGFLCLITFITYISEAEKRTALEELRKKESRLMSLNHEKSEYLRTVTHELKNPILLMQELATHLAEPGLSDKQRAEYTGFIAASGERMSELVRTLLDTAAIESGRVSANKKPVPVNDLVYTYINETIPLAHVRKMQMVPLMPMYDVVIDTDPDRLEQVLDNFISNAMQHCPSGTSIYVSLDETQAYTEVSVRDEGPGIAAHLLPHLFQPLSGLPPGVQNSGLGLTIVKKIADSLDAEVGCTSECGQGSTFYIRFPKNGE